MFLLGKVLWMSRTFASSRDHVLTILENHEFLPVNSNSVFKGKETSSTIISFSLETTSFQCMAFNPFLLDLTLTSSSWIVEASRGHSCASSPKKVKTCPLAWSLPRYFHDPSESGRRFLNGSSHSLFLDCHLNSLSRVWITFPNDNGHDWHLNVTTSSWYALAHAWTQTIQQLLFIKNQRLNVLSILKLFDLKRDSNCKLPRYLSMSSLKEKIWVSMVIKKWLLPNFTQNTPILIEIKEEL